MTDLETLNLHVYITQKCYRKYDNIKYLDYVFRDIGEQIVKIYYI